MLRAAHAKWGCEAMAQEQRYGPVMKGPVVARAWRDAAFKQRLLAEPVATLREAGIGVPDDVQVRVVENSDNVVHLILRAKPTGDLTDEELDQVAAARGAAGGVIMATGN